MDKEVMVSVVCLAYNHQKYIKQTLEGFVSQKTTFNYEIIVHDDASTDNTADIIREYAERYPTIIKAVLQTKNQHSQKTPIHKNFTAPQVTGKYVALCEGDDFWTDENKLQKQFEIMESNPDCSICTHKVSQILEDGTEMNRFRPKFDLAEGKISLSEFLKFERHYPFQTASYFMKSSLWFSFVQEPPAFRKAADVGDEPLLLFMLTKGDLYYIQDCMSVYRIFSEGSWSSRTKHDLEKKKAHYESIYNMMCLFDEYTKHCYNCNLDYHRGKLLFMKGEYRALLTQKNRASFKQLPRMHKWFVCVGAISPSFAFFVRKMLNKKRRRR